MDGWFRAHSDDAFAAARDAEDRRRDALAKHGEGETHVARRLSAVLAEVALRPDGLAAALRRHGEAL